ncbi:MAG: HAD-IIB family hydrolase [Bacillaceae bacterium]|nr:HAD-IIB family hydrolase [Bacillaceae bacterium]
MKVKLVAIDIDGTLITDEGELTAKTIEAISEVQNQGIKVVLATGRHLITTLPIQEN